MIKKVTKLNRLISRSNPLLTDPTGTGLERRTLEREITRRFRNLKREITRFIAQEDAFGLRDSSSYGSLLLNDFCPTGKGGGIDPTCSPGGVKKENTPSLKVSVNHPSVKILHPDVKVVIDEVNEIVGEHFPELLKDDQFKGVEFGSFPSPEHDTFTRTIRMPAYGMDKGVPKVDPDGVDASTVVHPGLKGTLVHELAHAVDYHVKSKASDLVKDDWFEIKKSLRLELGDPSIYGSSKPHEWFAEQLTKELLGEGGPLVDHTKHFMSGLITNQLVTNKAASTQVNILDAHVVTRVMEIQGYINSADVIKLEDNPHITIRYGLEDIDPERVARIIKQHQSIDVQLGGLSLFQGEDQDVLKIDVKSKTLKSINSHLSILPNTQTYSKYVPHLTVAYLKPGTGNKYVGRSGLEKTRLTFKSMVYSDIDRNHTSIYLNQKSRYIELSFNASSCGAGAEGSPGFQPGNTCGSGGGNGVKLPPQVDANIERSRGIISGFLWGEGFRKQTLMDNGADSDAIDEMDKLFDQHRWGEGHQEIADAKIAEEINKDTPLGKALRIQSAVETELLDRYEKMRNDLADKTEAASKKEMKESWEEGWGRKNDDAYSSWEEQWNVEDAYKIEDMREPLKFYRKGGLDKDVVPTSTNKYGAQSHAVIGSQSAQPHFEPTTEKTSMEMKAAGYQVLGGLGYIQMGYSGENEITWVKVKPLVTNILITNAPFSFLSSEEKLNGFAAWLKERVSITVLAKSFLQSVAQQQDHWLTQYINKTFLGGMGKMFDYLKRPELQESLDFYNGTRAQFLESAFARPPAVERVKLLASRAFNELQGVTDQMAVQMQRTLVDGFIRGDSPFVIARDLNRNVDDIGIKRARTIARTEVVRSHNEGALETMEAQGMDKVGVAVEWSTSKLGITKRGNPSPCKLCAPLAGAVFTLKEAHGLLPRHPS